MSSENIKEQIQQESENKKEIVQVLDVCRSEIIKLIKPFVKEELENKINEYCSQLRKLCDCVEKKVGLEQELSREEAMELWEQV